MRSATAEGVGTGRKGQSHQKSAMTQDNGVIFGTAFGRAGWDGEERTQSLAERLK